MSARTKKVVEPVSVAVEVFVPGTKATVLVPQLNVPGLTNMLLVMVMEEVWALNVPVERFRESVVMVAEEALNVVVEPERVIPPVTFQVPVPIYMVQVVPGTQELADPGV
jgi:hypothetical protein